jgi:hypothetical protein
MKKPRSKQKKSKVHEVFAMNNGFMRWRSMRMKVTLPKVGNVERQDGDNSVDHGNVPPNVVRNSRGRDDR